jgi:hypothetical protein
VTGAQIRDGIIRLIPDQHWNEGDLAIPIPEGNTGKVRKLGDAHHLDRVVQANAKAVLEPVSEAAVRLGVSP